MSQRRRILLACALALPALPALLQPAAAAEQFPTEHGTVRVTELATGLVHPWAVAALPDSAGFLITERPGRLRLLGRDAALGAPIEGVPAVHASGQGGLLDVALSPDFARDRLVYLAYAEAGEGGRAGTAVGRGRLSSDARSLEGFTVLFRQEPKLSTGHHFGSRLVFSGDGHLFVTLGENNQRSTAQDLDKLQGKVVRLNPDGSVPGDNPFVGKSGARPEIWSYGHRNPQGAALHPETGVLWVNEHGPRGGDEINIPEPGKNYGWPLATHGINYSGQAIPEAKGETARGAEAPHYVWEESPAISGMAFYPSEGFAAWRDSVFIGALKSQELIRLQLDGDRVVGEERMLEGLSARIRDVRAMPDGSLLLLTDARDGKLLKLEPQP